MQKNLATNISKVKKNVVVTETKENRGTNVNLLLNTHLKILNLNLRYMKMCVS